MTARELMALCTSEGVHFGLNLTGLYVKGNKRAIELRRPELQYAKLSIMRILALDMLTEYAKPYDFLPVLKSGQFDSDTLTAMAQRWDDAQMRQYAISVAHRVQTGCKGLAFRVSACRCVSCKNWREK